MEGQVSRGVADMDASGRIEQALTEAIAGGLPGIAAAARLPDGSVVEAAAGVRGLDNPAPMTPDTVFWIASFTKAHAARRRALQLLRPAASGSTIRPRAGCRAWRPRRC